MSHTISMPEIQNSEFRQKFSIKQYGKRIALWGVNYRVNDDFFSTFFFSQLFHTEIYRESSILTN